MASAMLWQWIALSLGMDPDRGVPESGERAQKFVERMRVARSCESALGIGGTRPQFVDTALVARTVFIKWATEEVKWQLPEEFVGPPAESNPPASDAPRKLPALRRLVLGMAVASPYYWDPDASRSDATGSIRTVLDTAGLSLDDKTIREHLREAFDALNEQDKATVRNAVKGNAARSTKRP